MIPVTRVDVTPGSTGWQDVDVTSHVGGDAGSVALVYLEIVNETGTERAWGIRKNGSTDSLTGILEDTGHTWIAIGVDSSDIFEINFANISENKVYLVGYATTAEAGNLTNAVKKTVGADATYTDIDISGDTTGGVAVCAFFKVKNTHATEFRTHFLRQNGGTPDRPRDMYNGDIVGFASACDGSEVLEGFAEIAADIEWHLTCWLEDNFTAFDPVKVYSAAGAGANEDVDVSADVPSGNDGAFFYFAPATSVEYKGLLIKKGSGITEYQDLAMLATPWVELDANRVAEQKVESTGLDLFLWGYTSQPAGGVTRSLAGSQPAATGILTRIEQALRALAGSQPAATGTLARIEQAVRALAGDQPAATGTLTRVHGRPRSVAGEQPAATGTLTRIEQALRALVGVQPSATGTLTRIEKAVRALSGDQPSATGTLTHDAAPTRSLAGDQPAATGALTRIYNALRALTGDQPSATGALTRTKQALRALTGSQPSATGTLTRQEQAVRALTGDQPSATGTLTYVFTAGPGVTIPQRGGGVPVKVGVRLPDLPPARTLEPVALPAIATFWSIVTIDWVLAVEGVLAGRVWVSAEPSMRRSREAQPALAVAALRGSGDIEWAVPRLQREVEKALEREREAEEEVLLGL